MDFSCLLGAIKRVLLGLAVALVLLLSLHGLGFSWKSSLIMASLPAVLGSLNLFSRQIYLMSGLTMVAACAVTFVSGEEAHAEAAGIAPADQPLVKARAALEDAAPAMKGLAASLSLQVDAAAAAAGHAAQRITPALAAVTSAAMPAPAVRSAGR